jgi:hypothetical protein
MSNVNGKMFEVSVIFHEMWKRLFEGYELVLVKINGKKWQLPGTYIAQQQKPTIPPAF